MKRFELLMLGIKKAFVVFALLPIFSVVFFTTSDALALKHEYSGVSLFSAKIPFPQLNPETGKYELVWDYSSSETYTFGTSGLVLNWEGDALDQSWFDSLNLQTSASRLLLNSDLDDGQYTYQGLQGLWYISEYNGRQWVESGNYSYYYPSSWRNLPSSEQSFTLKKFGDTIPEFKQSSVPPGLLQCDRIIGAVCGGLWNTREYISSQILPFSYSYDGFYLKSKYIDTESGVHYNNTFSLSDLLNKNVPKFSYFALNLDNYDGYFHNSENLYQYRQVEFKGVFEFDGSFAWHDNISTNGSYFRLDINGVSADDGQPHNQSVNCSTILRELPSESYTQLEFSCPLILDHNYLAVSPSLQISGNGNYVWVTDSDWRFAGVYVVTDNDETPGPSFNSHLTGGGTIPGDAQNQVGSGDADWFSSLTQMFSFGFLNPFLPLYQMFSDNSSCAQIPILASMLHSESSSVCPFFDSNTRNIMTPVLGIVGVMIVFGFAVRWLGARSGNYVGDSEESKWNSSGVR